MSILSAESRRRECKLIGGYLPVWIYEYMALYSVAKARSMSTVLRMLLESWIKEIRQEESDQILIEEVTKRLQERWLMEKKKVENVEEAFECFKKLAEQELIKKGIKSSYVKLILMEVKR